MNSAVSAMAAAPVLDAPPPLRLPADLRLTVEQFQRVCAENPEAVLELGPDGQLITMTPTGSETGVRNFRLVMRLLLWADQRGGWKVFDSSSGFRLPDGSVRSPDASLVHLERWQSLTPEQRLGLRLDLAEIWAG
jgi:Uma2 family endonuclease